MLFQNSVQLVAIPYDKENHREIPESTIDLCPIFSL